MTLAELISEVYTLTGRPDRVAETLSGIKAATLKAHQTDYYYKDIYEGGVGFGSAEFIQNLVYREVLPKWRAVKYFRKYDLANATPGKHLTHIVPENVMDRYLVEKDDIYYVAGAEVTIKSSTKEQYYLFGAYLHPDITESGYNSWIAEDHPFYIVYEAAATVFKAIGKDEEAAAFRGMVAEQLQLIKISNISPLGY